MLTIEALPFLKDGIKNYLAAENAAYDARNNLPPTLSRAAGGRGSTTAFAHFDNCTFSDSSFLVHQDLEDAVDHAATESLAPLSCPTTNVNGRTLRPECDPPLTGVAALNSFADALHTIQDFYAHTNWVERRSAALFFDKLGPFPVLFPTQVSQDTHGLFVAEQDRTLFRGDLFAPIGAPRVLSYPRRVEPDARVQGARVAALISGDTTQGRWVERTYPARCPQIDGSGRPFVVSHAELAKDGLAEHPPQFATAFLAARLQTTHEWCRFLDRVYSKFSSSGVAHVCDEWVKDAAAANVACPSLRQEAQCPTCSANQISCNGRCVNSTCGAPWIFNPSTCGCDCPAGTVECNSACVPNVCAIGQTFDASVCTCVCSSCPPTPTVSISNFSVTACSYDSITDAGSVTLSAAGSYSPTSAAVTASATEREISTVAPGFINAPVAVSAAGGTWRIDGVTIGYTKTRSVYVVGLTVSAANSAGSASSYLEAGLLCD